MKEPTGLRSMVHFANTTIKSLAGHFLVLVGKNVNSGHLLLEQLAVTMFPGVGYLGRPVWKRHRPGDASGFTDTVRANA